jgi:hypothetical protein
MKPLLIGLAALGLATSLSACASSGYGYGHSHRSLAFDTYYDDFYGPYYSGYWGGDGTFYYQTGPRTRWLRDNDHHFRRDAFHGYHGVHSRRHRH